MASHRVLSNDPRRLEGKNMKLMNWLESVALAGLSFAMLLSFIMGDTATGYGALSCLFILSHHIWEKNKSEK